MGRTRVRDDVAFGLGLAVAIVILVGLDMPAFRASRIVWDDFSFVWAGPRALLDGVDPYDPDRFPGLLSRYFAQPGKESWWIYPPWVAVGLIPLALLPERIAVEVWTYGGMILAAFALRSLLHLVAPGRPVVHAFAGSALLASQPAVAGYWSGQWSFLLTAALAAASVAAMRGGVLRALAGLALLGKPHLFILALGGLAEALRANGHRRELFALLASGAVLVIVPVLLMPGWLRVALSSATERVAGARLPTTLPAALSDLIGPAGPVLALAILVAAAVVALRLEHGSMAWVAAWTALSIAASPYGWSYDHLPLIVPLTLGVALVSRSERSASLVAAIAFGAFLLIPTLLTAVADVRKSETYSAVVPLAVLAFVLACAWVARKRPVAEVAT